MHDDVGVSLLDTEDLSLKREKRIVLILFAGFISQLRKGRYRNRLLEIPAYHEFINAYPDFRPGGLELVKITPEKLESMDYAPEVQDRLEEENVLRCAACNTREQERKFKKCGRYRLVFYCSKLCQKNHWREHKQVCA